MLNVLVRHDAKGTKTLQRQTKLLTQLKLKVEGEKGAISILDTLIKLHP